MPRPLLPGSLAPAAALALSMSLAACATPAAGGARAEAGLPAGEVEGTGGCQAENARFAIGQQATQDIVEQARAAAGAQIARTLAPGQMVTMEYHPSRLNIDVDADNVVTQVRCG